MKKITLLAAVLVAVSFASCKKDRTCECTYTNSGTTNVTSHTSTLVMTKVRKADAKYVCTKDSKTASYTMGSTTNSSTSTADCKLK